MSFYKLWTNISTHCTSERWTLWNETAALHLEEPLKLNDWIYSKNRRSTPAGTADWTLLEGKKQTNKWGAYAHAQLCFSLRCSLTLDFLKLHSLFYQVIVLIIFRHVPLEWFTSRAEQNTEYLLSRVTHWFLNTMGCFEMLRSWWSFLFVFVFYCCLMQPIKKEEALLQC